jgi:1-acyl-sn-glycerol-3-phosphate acyltransferase
VQGEQTRAGARTFSSRPDPAGSVRGAWRRISRSATTLTLDLLVLKPLAIFVWWFSHLANEVSFPGRRDLLRRVNRALAEDRPVVVALNHVSWFDDPVIPMALYATGRRAFCEFLTLGSLATACWLLPAEVLPPPAGLALVVAGALLIALLGARKVWWTLGDLVNLSDASVLRGKIALTRKTPPGPLLRASLGLADRAIPWFMRSGTTKTVFVDRRPGEEAKRTRARAIDATLDLAARLEPVWVFFEGGRTRVPGVLAPARRGIGSLILGLRERGLDPLVVVVYHHGMERLIPPGGSRFLAYGHRVEVRWSVFDVDARGATVHRDQEIADAVREVALRLQASVVSGEAQLG